MGRHQRYSKRSRDSLRQMIRPPEPHGGYGNLDELEDVDDIPQFTDAPAGRDQPSAAIQPWVSANVPR